MIRKILYPKTILEFKSEDSDFYIQYNEMQLKQMFASDHYFYGWFEDETLVGYIIVLDLKQEFELISIVVKKGSQNKGIGHKLLSYVVENIVLGNKLFVEVNENNKNAINFYKKLNFMEMGKRKKYYSNGADAILMVLSHKWFDI